MPFAGLEISNNVDKNPKSIVLVINPVLRLFSTSFVALMISEF